MAVDPIPASVSMQSCASTIERVPLRQHEELKMNQQYYDAVTKMEKMGVDPEYIQGWQGGYLLNPEREEQRVTEAYSAGYEDGKERNTDNFSDWVK
jgi:hypothetical protein